MAIVVIGGQARDLGKTSVVCALIAAMPERRWTAIKITQCKHDETEACDCELAGRLAAISEEVDATRSNDSSRYLAAGAMHSFWVRTRRGGLVEVMQQVRAEIARAENVVFESNSVLAFLQPDLYAVILDPRIADFKESARGYLQRADAILLPTEAEAPTDWPDVPGDVPRFRIAPPDYTSPEFTAFVARRLFHSSRGFAPSTRR